MTLSTVVAGILLSFTSVAPSLAQAAVKHTIDIREQQLGSALTQLAKQTHIQVVYTTDLVEGHSTQALSGSMTPEEALNQLLSRTGLRYEFLDPQTVTLSRVPAERKAGSATSQVQAPTAATNTTTPPGADATKGGEKRSFWDRFRLAQVDQGQAVGNASVANNAATQNPVAVEEVVVTAQKRIERLQDVPVPVAVVNADTLVESNQLRLKDYYTKVPGLNLTTGVRGDTQLSIRGLSSGVGTIPTVGVTIDDVPYGSSVALTGGFSTPDVDPNDLARVEVLRGPQGTLYGANSIGGLLKFVTIDPSADAFSSTFTGGLNDTYNADEVGYNARAAINVPLGDTVAIRVSGFSRRIPGYIDNIVTGEDSANETKVDGGRASLLWSPSQDLSLKLSGLIQDNRTLGSQLVNLGPGLGDLEQNAPRNTGWLNRKMKAYSAVLQARLGSADLTSVTGYNESEQAVSAQSGANALFENLDTEKFTQEIRAEMPLGNQFQFLLGAFYTHEKTQGIQDTERLDPARGVPTALVRYDAFPGTYEEYAAFADLTYEISDRLDVQIGGRATQNRQTYSRASSGPSAPNPAVLTERRLTDDSLTYLLTPRFKLSPKLMIYARFASGYRPGSLNSGVSTLPLTYEADTTLNYEVGLKGDLFDDLLSLDMSVYYIDWKDVQVLVIPPPPAVGNYFDNAGRARSQGVELSFAVRPVAQLNINGWVAYSDAELTEDFPPGPATGRSGDRLPFSARWSANLAVDQSFAVTNEMTGFVGTSLSYVGARNGSFVASTLQRQSFPSYTQWDLHTGVESETWKVTVYGNNLADRRGAITGNPAIVPSGVLYIQPRTLGVTVTKTF